MGGILSGKVVLVTGAGNGIGREIALLAAREGAQVVVNDLGSTIAGQGSNSAPAEGVVAEIRAAGGYAIANFGSVAVPGDAEAMVGLAVERFGRIDAVINSAGNFRLGPVHEIDEAAFDAVLKVHLHGAFNVSRAASPFFLKQGSGAFLHTTSSSGLIGSLGAAAYAAAKGGVIALSRSLALDMAQFGIRSNCIAPSAVSRMAEVSAQKKGAKPPPASANAISLAQPAKVAPLAVFMISDRACGLTGQILGVRGNEIFLYNQSRPVRALHRADGWTAEQLADIVMSAWSKSLVPLENFQDVFSWPPI